jgi:prepilin signal peptidase PulO-like enzyme (type II secretory pathway)
MIILLSGFVGWLGGIFVNYLADVLPSSRRLGSPVCVYCFEKQSTWNYLLWPKRCPECQKKRPLRVWVVEIAFVIVSIWLSQSPPDRLGYYLGFLLFLYFGVVVVIDMEHRLILHPVSLVGGVFCFVLGLLLHGVTTTIIGGVAGFSIMLVLHLFGDLFARWLARRRGEVLTEVALGFGDVNLSGVLGLLLGWPGIIVGLILAILLGGLVSLIYILVMLVNRRYRTFAAIPYGPFLVASGIILVFFKDLLVF